MKKKLVGYFFGPEGTQPIYETSSKRIGRVSDIKFWPEAFDLTKKSVRKKLKAIEK
ncbi:hypothetical protein GWO43_16120 [candidate division KSB1 bacterium]|nr:hypothetical protein [candidate division KSB1 bacterium]NIT72370.1 hypothetical protein [candidate division KSB1 bacterium]NIX72050.1 hypothetical protein [candidate division KSB1 bacterium]